MKKFRKVAALFLLCVVVLSLAGPIMASTSQAAKKPVLSPKKVTLKVGQMKKITLKNAAKAKKTTWKAKPAKAVKLTKKSKTGVRVKGVKRTNRVVLTAKFKLGKKMKTAKCTIKVNAKTNDNVTAEPTIVPTVNPTAVPTEEPTESPTAEPTIEPMQTKQPVQSARPFPSSYPLIATLPKTTSIPNLLKYFNSSKEVTAENWKDRMDEVRELYQVYMYGMYRSGEAITADYSNSTLSVTVENEKASGTITATITLPSGEAPETGWPAMIGFGEVPQRNMFLERGYATIDLATNQIAADQAGRRGLFYDLYPYGQGTNDWKNQTGVLMAWAWGASKIIDGLETGIGDELNIDQDILMVTGVSRYGKAAAVTGAFDKRIRVTVPACSGAAGMVSMRYDPNKLTFNLTSLEDFAAGMDETCTYGPIGNGTTGTEGFGSLSSSGEAHWFNTIFLSSVTGYNGTKVAFPFDQHFLAALCVEEDRLLFGTSEFTSGMWTNAPAHWLTYLKAQETLKTVGLEDNYAIRFHRDGHRLLESDIEYLLDFVEYKIFHKKPTKNLDNLKTSLFETNAENKAAFESKMPPSL